MKSDSLMMLALVAAAGFVAWKYLGANSAPGVVATSSGIMTLPVGGGDSAKPAFVPPTLATSGGYMTPAGVPVTLPVGGGDSAKGMMGYLWTR